MNPGITIEIQEPVITINFVQGLQGPAGIANVPDLNALPRYTDDDDAKSNGLTIGDAYIVNNQSDTLVPGTVKLIIA
jgi:hypothetical protein